MSINIHGSVPVNIGGIVLYCEKFKATGTKIFSEQNTVSGEGIITNYGKKAVRITLGGRICEAESPVGFIARMDALMKSDEVFGTEYKNTVFGKCRVQAFSAEDENREFISVSVTVTAEEVSEKSGEDSE